jgi:hypothetical protein
MRCSTIEATNAANPNRIGALYKNDQNGLRRRFGCERAACTLRYEDHGHAIGQLIQDQRRPPVILTLPPPVFDHDASRGCAIRSGRSHTNPCRKAATATGNAEKLDWDSAPHHAVLIAPGLWLASPKNGNISNVGWRLSAISR